MPISNGRNAVAHAATWLSAVSACAACSLLPFSLPSSLRYYLTLLSLFCADWRWLPLSCSRSGRACEKVHKFFSGLGPVLTTPRTQLQAGETCLTGWFGMRLLALAACLTAICRPLHVLRPHAEPLVEGMYGSFAAARAGRGLFAMAERHADQCKRRCGLLKPLGWAQQKGRKTGEEAQA